MDRLRAALASAEQRARTQRDDTDLLWSIWALATALNHRDKTPTERLQMIEHTVEREWLTTRVPTEAECRRWMAEVHGASPEGRGSATP
jgi:hypothetical protein